MSDLGVGVREDYPPGHKSAPPPVLAEFSCRKKRKTQIRPQSENS